MIPLRYNVRSLLVRRTTSIATLVGIALVVFVLAAALMLSEGIRRTLGSSGAPDHAIVLRKGSDAEMASSIENPTVGIVLSAPGVKKDASGKPIGSGEVMTVIALNQIGSDTAVSNVQVRGVGENVMALRPEVRVIAGRPAKPGTDEVMIGQRIRGRFKGMELGQTFELKKNRPLTVVGILDAGGSTHDSEVWADLDTVRTSFGRDGLVSSVNVQLESPAKFDAFKSVIEHDKQLGLEAVRETVYFEKQSENMAFFFTILGAVISVFFIVAALIGAFITMNTAVAHRQREIGTMRALGFSRFSVLLSFVLEALVLSLGGAALGIVAAFGLTFIKVPMMNFATWSEIVFTFEMAPGAVVVSIIVGAVMGLLGGIIPAARAALLKPIDALRA